MFCGYYRKSPYRGGLGLGPIGGYNGMFAPDWMRERALEAAWCGRPFNCLCPCGCGRCLDRRRCRCGGIR